MQMNFDAIGVEHWQVMRSVGYAINVRVEYDRHSAMDVFVC